MPRDYYVVLSIASSEERYAGRCLSQAATAWKPGTAYGKGSYYEKAKRAAERSVQFFREQAK